jgi:hypothetical protein
MIDVMLEASRIYKDARYQASAEKAGDFIILAQMPDPQPAWAQQYDAQMHPAWARSCEPPAITGRESVSVMRGLILLYSQTGKKKYLEPIPRALDYLKRSSWLRDGKPVIARFYGPIVHFTYRRVRGFTVLARQDIYPKRPACPTMDTKSLIVTSPLSTITV